MPLGIMNSQTRQLHQKRWWRKEFIIEWLRCHNVPLTTKATKAESMKLAFSNLPEKRYVTDPLAAKYSTVVLQDGCYFPSISWINVISNSLPIKHCMLNPIELSWSRFKRYVLNNNTNFLLSDVRKLTRQRMASLDVLTVISYHEHVRKIENTYKISGDFVESIKK